MFPPVEPTASGTLIRDDGNRLYWEATGNPQGRPVVFLHGGPGSGLGTGSYRRWVDPERSWLVGFDQRGCGRSRPLATDSDADLSTHTTAAVIADVEALRTHLGIERWLVTGGSWGTALGLAYAQAHPDRVTGLVLAAVGTDTRDSVEWLTEDMRRVFPREWDTYASAVPRTEGERVVDAYARALSRSDPEARAAAALAWCRWEDTHMSFDPHWQPFLVAKDPAFRLVFTTLVTHYWSRATETLEDVLARMDRIAHLPAVLIHGRLDISSPLEVPWRLHRAWPGSRLVVLDEGHGGLRMNAAIVSALGELG